MRPCSRLLAPLVDGRVNSVLLQTVPNINEALLQLINSVLTTVTLHTVAAAQHSRPYSKLDLSIINILLLISFAFNFLALEECAF